MEAYHLYLLVAGFALTFSGISGVGVPYEGFNYCNNLEFCLEVIDKGCTGTDHEICIKLMDSGYCRTLLKTPTDVLDRACAALPVPGETTLGTDVALGAEICQTVPMTQIGTIGFYINDGAEPTGATGSTGPTTLTASSSSPVRPEVTCEAFSGSASEPLCGDTAGDPDLDRYTLIKFEITECPTTTTTATTSTTTTTEITTTTAESTTTATTTSSETTATTGGTGETTATTPSTTVTTPSTAATSTTVALPKIPSRKPGVGCTITRGNCSVSCGSGTRDMVKTCRGRSVTETELCTLAPCTTTEQPPVGPGPKNGGYSDWSPWSVCSQTCRTIGLSPPLKARVRACNNPVPSPGGLSCVNNRLGDAEQRISCVELPTCPTASPPTIAPPTRTNPPVVVPPQCRRNQVPCRNGYGCCRRRRNKGKGGKGKGRKNKRNKSGNKRRSN